METNSDSVHLAHPVPSEGSISDERMPDWRISQIADEHRTTFDGKEHLDEISFARSLLSQSRVGAEGEQAGWPANKDAEPVAFPKLPPAIVMHTKLGELFDRLQMQVYAMGYAMACAASPKEQPVQPTGVPVAIVREAEARLLALYAASRGVTDEEIRARLRARNFMPDLAAAIEAAATQPTDAGRAAPDVQGTPGGQQG